MANQAGGKNVVIMAMVTLVQLAARLVRVWTFRVRGYLGGHRGGTPIYLELNLFWELNRFLGTN